MKLQDSQKIKEAMDRSKYILELMGNFRGMGYTRSLVLLAKETDSFLVVRDSQEKRRIELNFGFKNTISLHQLKYERHSRRVIFDPDVLNISIAELSQSVDTISREFRNISNKYDLAANDVTFYKQLHLLAIEGQSQIIEEASKEIAEMQNEIEFLKSQLEEKSSDK